MLEPCSQRVARNCVLVCAHQAGRASPSNGSPWLLVSQIASKLLGCRLIEELRSITPAATYPLSRGAMLLLCDKLLAISPAKPISPSLGTPAAYRHHEHHVE